MPTPPSFLGRGRAPRKAKLRVESTLSPSDPSIGSSIRTTPMTTCNRVPCGVAQLQVLAQSCGPIDTTVANLQVTPLEIHLKIHLITLVPALGTLFWSDLHSQ